jgi:hypothetical protein
VLDLEKPAKKKAHIINIIIMIIIGTSLIAGSTFAIFFSSASNSQNHFDTGKVAISMDKPDGIKYFNVENIVPGDTGFENVIVTNTGSIELGYKVKLEQNGKLSEGVNPIQIKIIDNQGAFVIPDETYKVLPAGSSETLKLSWELPLAAGNEYQNESSQLALLINAENNAYKINDSATGTGNGLLASYYSDMYFQTLATTSVDSMVNFNWGTNAPNSLMPVNNFTIEWIGKVQPLYSEEYTFYTISDDGVRLWVDDKLVIDNWTDHAKTENSGKITLLAGVKYNIKIQYYEKSVDALISLLWSSPSQTKQVVPQSQLFTVDYISSYIRTGGNEIKVQFTPKNSLSDIQVVYSKNGNVPQTAAMQKNLSGYDYTIGNLSVGDKLSYSFRYIKDGLRMSSPWIQYTHTISPINGLVGMYYNGKTFTTLVNKKVDEVVNFNWGYTTNPINGLGTDNYCIRWIGEIQPLYSERYNFFTNSDDGVRLYVDGKLIINNWTDHIEIENKGTIDLIAGKHYLIVMEYYEKTAVSVVSLSWDSNSQVKQIVPNERLFVTGF